MCSWNFNLLKISRSRTDLIKGDKEKMRKDNIRGDTS